MSTMYKITKENYKKILDRILRKTTRWRMLTEKTEYWHIGRLTRSGKYPEYKKGLQLKSYGKGKKRAISRFVYATNSETDIDLPYKETGLIVLDLDVGSVISIREGDWVKIEKYGFTVYQQIFDKDIPGVSVWRFIMLKGCPAARITDYKMAVNTRKEEWMHLYEDAQKNKIMYI